MYAGKLTTLNDATVNDPIQYSCQKNFTLLSTDGYWNGNDGFQADGSTDVGNQDAAAPRPFNDGGTGSTLTCPLSVSAPARARTTVSSIKINGVEILSSTADSSSG